MGVAGEVIGHTVAEVLGAEIFENTIKAEASMNVSKAKWLK